VWLFGDDFRGHIGRSAAEDGGERIGLCGIVVAAVTEAEVDYFDL
jgi:hypothetical protein